MTKKDYIKIAAQFANAIEIIKENKIEVNSLEIITALVKDFATMLQKDNERFDTDRFLTACGI